MRIAICDDELIFRDQIENLIREYFKDKAEQYEISRFCSGKALLESQSELIDLFF